MPIDHADTAASLRRLADKVEKFGADLRNADRIDEGCRSSPTSGAKTQPQQELDPRRSDALDAALSELRYQIEWASHAPGRRVKIDQEYAKAILAEIDRLDDMDDAVAAIERR